MNFSHLRCRLEINLNVSLSSIVDKLKTLDLLYGEDIALQLQFFIFVKGATTKHFQLSALIHMLD